jgi:outer membrane protein insertion porin family
LRPETVKDQTMAAFTTAPMKAALFAIVYTLLVATTAQSQNAQLIEDVQVRGNRRVPAESIKYNLRTKPGQNVSVSTIERDVKALYSLGFFDDIRVVQEAGARGVIVVFQVKERPLIKGVTYTGLQSVTSSEIVDKLREQKTDIREESPYDPVRIRRAQSIIKRTLADRGHPNATVEVRTQSTPPSSISVTFAVDEGPTMKIDKIDIEGNTAISDAELKRGMALVKESSPLTLFTHKDTYDGLKLNDDLTRIRMQYASKGYVRANVLEPVTEIRSKTIYRTFPFIKLPFPWGIPLPFWKEETQRMHVTLKVEENSQYRVGTVNISGNKEFSAEQIRFALGLIPGGVYDEERLRRGVEILKKMYGDRGFINFTPVPQQFFNDDRKVVNFSINIQEDRKFYVNRISFSGNTTTRDKVIRRELMVQESEVFNAAMWERSLLKLNQLGYFDPVRPQDTEMQLNPADGSVDISLKVKEKDKNKIGFNGGVGSTTGTFLGLSYSTTNFLGLGENMSVNLEGGTLASNYQFSFTEPYLFSQPISAGLSLFSNSYHYDQSGLNGLNFNESRRGFSLSASRPLRTFHRLGVTYQFDNSFTSSIDPATQEFFSTLAAGNQTTSGYFARRLMTTYSFNSTNHPITPTKGYSFSTSLESVGGFMGGNVNFYRPSFEFKAYKPVNHGRNTLAMRVSGAYMQPFANQNVPFYERLFMGGDFDLRGFDFRSVGPIAFVSRSTTTVDPTTGVSTTVPFDDIVHVGGDTQGLFNFEYRIPITGPFTLAPFFDVGNTWVLNRNALLRNVTDSLGQVSAQSVNLLPGTNSGLRISTGVELQITLPIINLPMRLIFAVNPSRIDRTYIGPTVGTPINVQQPFQGFRFSIGKTF